MQANQIMDVLIEAKQQMMGLLISQNDTLLTMQERVCRSIFFCKGVNLLIIMEHLNYVHMDLVLH